MYREVVATAAAAVALIECHDTGSKGSGFVVSDDGLVVTNIHVVAKYTLEDGRVVWSYSQRITVRVNGHVFRATVANDSSDLRPFVYDYALLKLHDVNNRLPVLIAGDNADAELGDSVICLGFPLDFEDLVVTPGIVTSKPRFPSHMNTLYRVNTIVTDATVQRGNSGGPMLHVRSGKVVGLNTRGHLVMDSRMQRLVQWRQALTDPSHEPLREDIIDFCLWHQPVGLTHAVSIEYARADAAWS